MRATAALVPAALVLSSVTAAAARVEGVIGLRDRRRGYTFGRDWSPLGFTSKGRALAPLVVAGYGITVPEAGYDDYAGLDVSGKLVLVLAGEPPRAEDAPLLGTGPAYHRRPGFARLASAGIFGISRRAS